MQLNRHRWALAANVWSSLIDVTCSYSHERRGLKKGLLGVEKKSAKKGLPGVAQSVKKGVKKGLPGVAKRGVKKGVKKGLPGVAKSVKRCKPNSID